jgi:endo-1,3-1,4-beta-glycanase ExoK
MPSVGFGNGNWQKADWANRGVFNVGFRPDHVKLDQERITLNLDDEDSYGFPFTSGEYRTRRVFGYGRYDVRMKVPRQSGIISSFFIYTGPADGTPHDEIDIEFLGRDTRKVQFNYHSAGQGGNEKLHDLGFDAADDFHDYGFEWRADFIAWFVDGVEVVRLTEDMTGVPIPTHRGKIMMNLWTGTPEVEDWLGPFAFAEPLRAHYKDVRFTP